MNSKLGLIAAAFVAVLSTACGHANFAQDVRSPDGLSTTRVSGTSYDPNTTIAVSANADVARVNANTYRMAVQNGMAYPYMGGMTGDMRAFYCPNGVCIQPPPPPAAAPVPGATAGTASQAQLDQTTKTAEEAKKKADAAIQVLKNLRAQGKLQ